MILKFRLHKTCNRNGKNAKKDGEIQFRFVYYADLRWCNGQKVDSNRCEV